MTKFILFGGKGGVGKTTIASSVSLSLAQQEYKTLIVSTDPAHSISDVFDHEISSDKQQITENLWAREIDPKQRFKENYAKTARKIMREAQNLGISVDTENLSGTDIIGSDEAAVIDLFYQYENSDTWDYVVFDTAPTGHTLRMLQLPEVLDSVVGTALSIRSKYSKVKGSIKGIFSNSDEDTIDDIDVEKTRNKLEHVSEVMQNSNKTLFFPVMEAEKLSLHETTRLITQLEEHDVTVGGVFINKVLEDINTDCEICSTRRDNQQNIIEQTHNQIDYPISELPLLVTPPNNVEELQQIADRISITVN